MIAWFARNGVAANLLMLVICLLGLWAVSDRIVLEVFPEFERDAVTISVQYRGATPAEVEEGALIRIEEAIADLEGIEEITASAKEGSGRVTVEVAAGRARELLDDIKGRVDAVGTFPADMERPVYTFQSFHREVIGVVVAGNLPERELRRLSQEVHDELAALPEVSQVERSGLRPAEISIEVAEQTLTRHGLTLDGIVNVIRQHSVDLPAGSIKTRAREIQLRTTGQARNAQDFARIPIISNLDGTRLTLGEIATLRDGFEEEPLSSRFNGQPAVMLSVYRGSHQSVIKVAQAVRDYVAAKQESLPKGIHLDYWRDHSRVVKLRLNTLLDNAVQGGILIFLCLALFLRLSVAIWVCIGIPISFMGALAVMPELGITLNLMSLFAFILVEGIVVDDSIVTSENIHAHMRRGTDGLTAAIRGTREVSVPVTFGFLTTVVAFLPLMFLGGVRGPIFAEIPMIVIPVLIASWVETKLILPAHLSHVRLNHSRPPGPLVRTLETVANGLERFILRGYQPFLERVLVFRYLTLALFFGLSFIIVAYVVSGRHGFTFFPRIQSEVARASLTMESGTPEAITARHLERITRAATTLANQYRDPTTGVSVIHNILTTLGSTSSTPGGRSSGGSPELGSVSLELVPPEERTLEVDTTRLVNEWRTAIGAIPGAKELNFRAEIGRGGDPIAIQLIGQDFTTLGQVAHQVRQRLGTYSGVFDIQDSLDDSKREINLTLRPEAQHLGLTTQDLGRQVRQAFFGAEVQRFVRGEDDIRVMVRYPPDERHSLEQLESMRIRTTDGQEIPIGQISDIELKKGLARIDRIDRQRTVEITADLDKEKVDANRIVKEMDEFLTELTRTHPGFRYRFEGETREQRESFGNLFHGALLTLFAIYALLAIPLRSYLQPLLVMLVIPLSIVGAIIGHLLLGMNLSLMSLMGMLALAGVVVNDSLVLMDWINQRRQEGAGPLEAARSCGVARFRAIFLTALTIFVGLVPLILEQSTQAQFLIPMAVSLGCGVVYGAFLSLLLVPSGYMILEDIKALVTKITSAKHS
ncbi:MAG: efflux RND transporter permease subunit [Magnetococcales bacterium]|nr:efflux RND transporter permease subunit [Magnetococcales bacterium]MBF0630705.1 efflux RND transporter permease subunit [Magnetococcales bacterium]